MTSSLYTKPILQHLLLASALFGVMPTQAIGIADERVRFTIIMRHLEGLDRLTDQSEVLPNQGAPRYHFDYIRLRDDLHRIRTGIQEYLTPQRAQPRDPIPLHGDYRDETALTP